MEVTQEINEICAELLERYKQEIKNTGHYASGELANTASYVTKWDGRYFELYFNLQEYWKWLENGRAPGNKPPYRAIRDWMIVKKLIPSSKENRIPRDYAFIANVRRNIAQNGIKPAKVLQKSLDGADDLLSKLADEFTKQLQEEINNEEI